MSDHNTIGSSARFEPLYDSTIETNSTTKKSTMSTAAQLALSKSADTTSAKPITQNRSFKQVVAGAATAIKNLFLKIIGKTAKETASPTTPSKRETIHLDVPQAPAKDFKAELEAREKAKEAVLQTFNEAVKSLVENQGADVNPLKEAGELLQSEGFKKLGTLDQISCKASILKAFEQNPQLHTIESRGTPTDLDSAETVSIDLSEKSSKTPSTVPELIQTILGHSIRTIPPETTDMKSVLKGAITDLMLHYDVENVDLGAPLRDKRAIGTNLVATELQNVCGNAGISIENLAKTLTESGKPLTPTEKTDHAVSLLKDVIGKLESQDLKATRCLCSALLETVAEVKSKGSPRVNDPATFVTVTFILRSLCPMLIKESQSSSNSQQVQKDIMAVLSTLQRMATQMQEGNQLPPEQKELINQLTNLLLPTK